MRTMTIFATALILLGSVLSPALSAQEEEEEEEGPPRLDDTAIFFEINDTDGDAGIQLFLDGEGWDTMVVRDPFGEVIFAVAGDAGIGEQGITELFFESAEPSFDEQPLDELLALFPAGIYQFRGRTTEGESINGTAKLTHDLPGAPVLVSPGDGDEVEKTDLVIEWQPVADPPGSRIVGYHVVVERDDDTLRVFTADMNRDITRVTVPPEFLQRGKPYKFEVLAIEASGNQTISEREFETAE